MSFEGNRPEIGEALKEEVVDHEDVPIFEVKRSYGCVVSVGCSSYTAIVCILDSPLGSVSSELTIVKLNPTPSVDVFSHCLALSYWVPI